VKDMPSNMLGAGYPIAAEAFDLEVYQLACTFAASREIARLAKTHPGLQQLSSVFQLSEAARRLIAVAAMARSAMDTWSSTAYEKKLTNTVGSLCPDVERPKEQVGLAFREACNKIIHADDMELLAEENDADVLRYDVVLDGEKRDRPWRAYLNVVTFLEVAAHVV